MRLEDAIDNSMRGSAEGFNSKGVLAAHAHGPPPHLGKRKRRKRAGQLSVSFVAGHDPTQVPGRKWRPFDVTNPETRHFVDALNWVSVDPFPVVERIAGLAKGLPREHPVPPTPPKPNQPPRAVRRAARRERVASEKAPEPPLPVVARPDASEEKLRRELVLRFSFDESAYTHERYNRANPDAIYYGEYRKPSRAQFAVMVAAEVERLGAPRPKVLAGAVVKRAYDTYPEESDFKQRMRKREDEADAAELAAKRERSGDFTRSYHGKKGNL